MERNYFEYIPVAVPLLRENQISLPALTFIQYYCRIMLGIASDLNCDVYRLRFPKGIESEAFLFRVDFDTNLSMRNDLFIVFCIFSLFLYASIDNAGNIVCKLEQVIA